MSQGLHLSQRMSQQMVLSPQLQQSLALLQAPVLELKAMVEQELQQNPVLEEVAAAEPTMEERANEGEDPHNQADPAEPPADTQFDPATEKPSNEPVDKFDEDLQRLLQLDQDWRDHFAAAAGPTRVSPEDEERRQFMFDSLTAETSLQEELLDQVRTADVDDRQRLIAELLVGNIDDHGYLQAGLEELSFSTGIAVEDLEAALKIVQSFQPPGVGARDLRECLMLQLERANRQETPEYRIVRDHMEALGKRRFPEIARHLGVTPAEAQKLSERLAQLDPRPGRAYAAEPNQYVVAEVQVTREDDGPAGFLVSDLVNLRSLARKFIQANDMIPPDRLSAFLFAQFSEPLQNELRQLAELGMSPDAQEPLRKTLAGELNRIIQDAEVQSPELFNQVNLSDDAAIPLKKGAASVRLRRMMLEDGYPAEIARRRATYTVSTSDDNLPHLRISNFYKDLLSNAETTAEARDYIRDKIKAGKFLIKSLHQRQSTIQNIAREIVKRQRDFFEHGVSHLRPMTMLQVAEVVGVHETTVSRAVSGKFMATPQGLVDMKFFFTSGVATSSGESMSNKSVKTVLAEMIAGENKGQPLSDEELVAKLKEKGIMIARRTVAKYRAELGVLPSHLRRDY